VEFERVDYTIDPLSRERLIELLGKLGLKPRALLRTKDPAYQELGLASPDVSDEVLLDAMAAHPTLVQRPIVERGARAVLARPAERVRALFAG
jgi:arsenate reductase